MFVARARQTQRLPRSNRHTTRTAHADHPTRPAHRPVHRQRARTADAATREIEVLNGRRATHQRQSSTGNNAERFRAIKTDQRSGIGNGNRGASRTVDDCEIFSGWNSPAPFGIIRPVAIFICVPTRRYLDFGCLQNVVVMLLDAERNIDREIASGEIPRQHTCCND